MVSMIKNALQPTIKVRKIKSHEKKVVMFIVLSILIGQLKAQKSLPQTVSGKIERIENFKSKYIASRTIDIWLPEGYSSSTKYAVLYMHDGQMLYDPEQSWNKQAWDIYLRK